MSAALACGDLLLARRGSVLHELPFHALFRRGPAEGTVDELQEVKR